MELSNKEAHCLARVLQSVLYGGHSRPFDGCMFCLHPCHTLDQPTPRFDTLLHRLGNETGVDLQPGIYGALRSGGFPYKKFLKNANLKVKDFFRNFFTDSTTDDEVISEACSYLGCTRKAVAIVAADDETGNLYPVCEEHILQLKTITKRSIY